MPCRSLRLAAAVLGGAATLLLSGCVVAPPAYPAYSTYPAYPQGYYRPAPAYVAPPVVVSPSIGFYGRWGGGGRYWRR